MIRSVRENPDEVYRLILKRLPSPRFLVDASKSLEWLEAGLTRRCPHPLVIHITKSVESFTASVLTRLEVRGPLERIGTGWATTNRNIRNYAVRHGLPYLHIRYTDFARDVEHTLETLGAFVGFDPQPEQREFWAHIHHYVKGNPGAATHFDAQRVEREPGLNRELYRQHHQTIFVDEKWKQLLTLAQVDRLYALPEVREESDTLGYSHPLRPSGPPLFTRIRGCTIESGLKLVRWLRRQVLR